LEPHRTARYYYLKIIRLKGDPQTLARGVTLGVFIGIVPIIPIQTIVIFLLAPICRGNTIAALLAGFLVSNPLTFFPQYLLSWKIGKWLIPVDINWHRVQDTVHILTSGDSSIAQCLAAVSHLGYEAIAVLVVGGMVLGLPFAILAYPLSLQLFSAIRRKRRQKHTLS